jgi:hypothetical protein
MPPINLDSRFFNHDAQAGGFFPITHINPGFDIRSLIEGTGKNMLIEGIRGTGKTHILKMVASNSIEMYNTKKVLPVYVSLAKITEWQESDIRLFRIQLYANIVYETISIIEKERSRIGIRKGGIRKAIDRITNMFGIKNSKDINDILEKIRAISEELLRDLTYNKEQFLEKIGEDHETTIAIGSEIKNNITSTLGRNSIGIDTHFNKLKRKTHENEVQYIGKTLAYENASGFIIEFFKQLKDLLGYKYVFLLLDECSEASNEAQIEIFRLLKLIRGSSDSIDTNYIYFCASVYPPYATNYPTRIRGNSFNFEPGQDAGVEYLQLDELTDEYEKFFLELIRKRLVFVREKQVVNPINEVFENEGAFFLAAYAANGIPRRFLEILKQGYDNLWQRSDSSEEIKKISQRDIETAIHTVASSQILSQSKLTQNDFKIIDELNQRISKRNRKTETENKEKDRPLPANVYFTITRAQFSDLNNLLLQGCVHDKGRTRLKKYYKEESSQGPLLMLDLAIAYQSGSIDRRRAPEIFRNDLKENAKSGYLYCQDFNLNQFEYKNYNSDNQTLLSRYDNNLLG